MAERIAENVWKVQNETLRMPVMIRDAAFAAAVFACGAAAARDAVAGTGLEPLVIGGRGFAALICVQYRDSDLGPYNEVGLLLMVRGPGKRTGMYTLDLPVTQEFTLEAGRDIWALPKWLARCDMDFGRRRTTVRLAEGDDFVLAAVLERGPVSLPFTTRQRATSFSVRAGESSARGRVLCGETTMRLSGLRLRPGGSRLVLGDHRMAKAARALGMAGRPLLTLTASRMTAELGEWDGVGG